MFTSPPGLWVLRGRGTRPPRSCPRRARAGAGGRARRRAPPPPCLPAWLGLESGLGFGFGLLWVGVGVRVRVRGLGLGLGLGLGKGWVGVSLHVRGPPLERDDGHALEGLLQLVRQLLGPPVRGHLEGAITR